MKPQKRKQILEIAEKLFNKFGIQKTGVDEIARLAQVAKGTIYSYFGNKESLFLELVNEKSRQFEELIEKRFATIKDPMGRLKIALVEHLKLFINNPFLSDKLLQSRNEDRIIRVVAELDLRLNRVIDLIFSGSYLQELSAAKKRSIRNMLLFALKGMNEAIKSSLAPVSIKSFEKEIDFLIGSVLPKQPVKSNGG